MGNGLGRKENMMNRVILSEDPIVSIHDQDAGGNVLKESMPNGAEMVIHNLVVGDPAMWAKELWVCCRRMLIREKDRAFLEEVGQRENVPVMVMGKITDTGRMVVKDSKTGETAVNLDLELVLGELPKDLTVMQALDRVLRLLSVGSKRFLTSKVDRSVTGIYSASSAAARCTCR